jgi:hypothetical protein
MQMLEPHNMCLINYDGSRIARKMKKGDGLLLWLIHDKEILVKRVVFQTFMSNVMYMIEGNMVLQHQKKLCQTQILIVT